MARITEKNFTQHVNSCHTVKELFKRPLIKLDDMIGDITRENDRLIDGQASVGFLYMGDFYIVKNASMAPTYGNRKVLDPSLYPKMQRYLNKTVTLIRDAEMVNQMVFRLLRGCITKQECRDAMPDCLANFMAVQLPRTQEAAFTLQGDERAMRQYEKVLAIIEFYVGSQLL